MAESFTLDTSGCVYGQSPYWDGTCVFWSGLTPFAQGYIEAAFASLVESTHTTGWAFRYLAPETLAAMLKDCEARGEEDFANIHGSTDIRREGRWFWEARQKSALPNFPPLTLYLGDDGLIYFGEV